LTAVLPAQVVHRDLNSGKKQVHSIVLMPVAVNLVRISMKGAEAMNEQSRNHELPLALEVEAALQERGYRLDRRALSPEALAKDPEERYAVDDLQKRFDAELDLIRHKSKDVRKGRFGIGDNVARLSLKDDVDALLFVRARGQILTGNKKAFRSVVAGVNGDATVLNFGIVDARTGEMLYFSKSKLRVAMTAQPDDIAEGIAKAFARLPQGHTALPGAIAVPDVATSGDSARPVGRIALSQKVVERHLAKYVRPEYPGVATMNGVEGDVIVHYVIDRNGQVRETMGVVGPVHLNAAATSAVMQWRYRPFVIDGHLYEVEAQTTLSFRLGAEPPPRAE
jgi:TonB family protein